MMFSQILALYELEVHSSGAIHFFVKYENRTVFGLRSNMGLFMFDNWTHLAVTYDLDDNKVHIKLKINKKFKLKNNLHLNCQNLTKYKICDCVFIN